MVTLLQHETLFITELGRQTCPDMLHKHIDASYANLGGSVLSVISRHLWTMKSINADLLETSESDSCSHAQNLLCFLCNI